jgi:hypothetical protein
MEHHRPILAYWLMRPSDGKPSFFRRCNLAQFGAIYLGRLAFQFCPEQLSLIWKSTTCEDCNTSAAAKAMTDREPRKRAEVAKTRASSEFKFQTLQLSKNRPRERRTHSNLALLNGNASIFSFEEGIDSTAFRVVENE